MTDMRAKLKITYIQESFWGKDGAKSGEALSFCAVCKPKYDETGLDEDNTFAMMSPSADLRIQIANPALWGKFAVGETFYLDFTKAEA